MWIRATRAISRKLLPALSKHSGHGSLGRRCGLLSNYFDLLLYLPCTYMLHCTLTQYILCAKYYRNRSTFIETTVIWKSWAFFDTQYTWHFMMLDCCWNRPNNEKTRGQSNLTKGRIVAPKIRDWSALTKPEVVFLNSPRRSDSHETIPVLPVSYTHLTLPTKRIV